MAEYSIHSTPHTQIFNKNLIVLNSAKAMYDLMDKRSVSFSDRWVPTCETPGHES